MSRHAPQPTGQVTFLFTDIEGSTRLSQQLGEAFSTIADEADLIDPDAASDGERAS